MDGVMPSDRLLAIIETQNEITATALDLDAVMTLIVHRAQELVGADAGVIELVDGDELVYHAGSGAAETSVGVRVRADGSLSALCVENDEALCCENTQDDARVDRDACERVGAVSMVCVPLRHEGVVSGVLKVYDGRAAAFDAVDVQTLSLFSTVIAAHMVHASEFALGRHANAHDALTDLPNRRSFDERLAAACARVRRHGRDVALCVLDLDRFKEINDTHGHTAGDDVLRAVAGHLVAVRGEDVAYRIGGDEFALILEETSEGGATQVVRRLALAINADPSCAGVGVSWGIAMVGGDPAEAGALADAALHRAEHGRGSAADASGVA
jgi:diguanylate cyclase (GGDEF)-like protein